MPVYFCNDNMIFIPVKVKLLHVGYKCRIDNMTFGNIRNKSRVITGQLSKRLISLVGITARVDRRLFMRCLPIAIMLLMPIVILGPLLGRGYILQYDMVFAPQVHLNIEAIREGYGLYQSLPLSTLLKLFSFVIPMDIVQKLIIYTIFFLSAFAMYRSVPVKSGAARLAAGIVYTINPFTYDRLMAGHWVFLLAYAITPWVLRSFYNLLTEPGRKQLVAAVLLWTLAVIISAHHLVILGLLFACFSLIFVRGTRSLLYALAAVGSVLFLNLWWIIPAIAAPGQAGSFGLEHFYAFDTKTDLTHGIWFNMLSLQGFWYTSWQNIKDMYGLWPLLVMVWLLPVFAGLGSLKGQTAKHQKLIISLLLAGFISLILAAGPYHAVSALNAWIFTHVPGMSGLRESQKFLALLALAYAVVAAYGFDILIQKKLKRAAIGLGVISIVATLLIVRPMLWGGNGQITLTNYPASWYRFQGILEGSTGQAVVLPWNLYVDDTFVDTLVANPARAFYGERVLQSQRMKLPGVQDLEPSKNRQIGAAADQKDLELLKEAMRESNARYIMVTEKRAGGEYDWLLNRPDLIVVINSPELLVLSLTSDEN